MPLWLRNYIGKRRFTDAGTRSGRALAKKLKAKTIVFYGEREGLEYPPLKKRCEETAKLAQKATLVRVSGAPHKIDFPTYQEAILRGLSSKT